METCQDCGMPLKDKRAIRCGHCASLSRENKKRQALKYCKRCGIQISRKSTYCRSCWRIGVPCSQETRLKISKSLKGHVPSIEQRKHISEGLKGKKKSAGRKKSSDSPTWNKNQHKSHLGTGAWRELGTLYKHPKGYYLIKVSHNNGRRNWVSYHRYVVEKNIGRPLLASEHVHHVDGNLENNLIENLVIVSSREHFLLNKILQFIRDSRGGDRLAKIIVRTVISRFPIHETTSMSGLSLS